MSLFLSLLLPHTDSLVPQLQAGRSSLHMCTPVCERERELIVCRYHPIRQDVIRLTSTGRFAMNQGCLCISAIVIRSSGLRTNMRVNKSRHSGLMSMPAGMDHCNHKTQYSIVLDPMHKQQHLGSSCNSKPLCILAPVALNTSFTPHDLSRLRQLLHQL